MKVITISSDANNPGHLQLKRSLDYFGYEYDAMIEPFQFGRQMKHIYTWCKANWGQFLYTDAWDTFALAPLSELQSKLPKCEILISAEKGCYPEERLRALYPKTDHDWRFVNAGGFLSTCEFFVKIYEDGSHHEEANDQTWLSEQFLKRDEILLDYDCKIFQTIAFEGAGDFSYEDGRLINNKTGEMGIFLHGNGRTDMKHIYKLL